MAKGKDARVTVILECILLEGFELAPIVFLPRLKKRWIGTVPRHKYFVIGPVPGHKYSEITFPILSPDFAKFS